MGRWSVDTTSEPGILRLAIVGMPTVEEMREFVAAHNAAIDAFKGHDYKVWCDISEMGALSPECAALFETAKRYSSEHKNFRGSAVYAPRALVALQHRRTSVEGGVMETELISDDLDALRKHLAEVYRR